MLRPPRAWISPELRRGVAAGVTALLVHGLLLTVVGALPGREPVARERLRPEPRVAQATIPLEGFEAPPVAQALAPVESVGVAPRPATAQAASAVPPARAAEPSAPTPASAPSPVAPEVVDFSSAPIARGLASAYVGAARVVGGASQALGAIAAGAPASGADAHAGGPAGAPAQPVRLAEGTPRCPWPSAAMAADIYQQTVMLRVEVDAEGQVVRASALSDPGHGFAAAAEACARRARFTPARDASGQPVRASSPPIRMRFER